jgi:hypothetical protein
MIVSCALLEQVVYHQHAECRLTARRSRNAGFSMQRASFHSVLPTVVTHMRVLTACQQPKAEANS